MEPWPSWLRHDHCAAGICHPFGSAIAGDSNMLSNIQRAIQTLGNEEVDFRDVDAMLSAAGLFNDTAASLAQLSHLGLDLGKILANAAD